MRCVIREMVYSCADNFCFLRKLTFKINFNSNNAHLVKTASVTIDDRGKREEKPRKK